EGHTGLGLWPRSVLVFDTKAGSNGYGAEASGDLIDVVLAQGQAGDCGDGIFADGLSVNGAKVERASIGHDSVETIAGPSGRLPDDVVLELGGGKRQEVSVLEC